MTGRGRMNPATPDFDRLMTAWLDAEARVQEPPDLIERILVRRRKTRPLPSWLLPERWLPMELTMRRARVPRFAGTLLLIALIVALAAGAIIVVGSRRAAPAPFGLAHNGRVLVATSAGDITTVDPFTGQASTVVTGPETDRFPVFSLDGERIAFVRKVDGGEAIFAVGADGGTPIRLTPTPVATASMLAWSPDGREIGFLAGADVWIARGDGSGAHRIATDIEADGELEWRPPAGQEILVRGLRDGLGGFFLVPVDGGSPRAITPIDGGIYDYLWPSWSPDGTWLAYSANSATSTHVLTVDGSDVEVKPDGGQGIGFPRLSPDASRLALMAWLPDGKVQVGVAPASDPTPTLTLTGPTFTNGIQFDWSPDGKSILAVEWTTDLPWILDPAGGPGTQASFRGTIPDWVEWQRRAE